MISDPLMANRQALTQCLEEIRGACERAGVNLALIGIGIRRPDGNYDSGTTNVGPPDAQTDLLMTLGERIAERIAEHLERKARKIREAQQTARNN